MLGIFAVVAAGVVVASATASAKHQTAKRAGLRAAAGHEVVRPLGAVRRARHEGRVREGRRLGVDQQRPERSAEAEGAGAGRASPHGAKVVIETALDNGSAASIEKLFTSKGGKAIDYDRQVSGGSASVYVTFDGKAVGAAQAKGVLAAMKANHTYSKSATVAELWGGQTDQNAFWFKSGNDAVLNPLFKSDAIKKGPTQFVPDWDANNAGDHLQPDARQDEQQHPGRSSRRTTTSPAP